MSCGLTFSTPQKAFVDRVEPMNWWVGMKHNNVQLLIHGKNVGSAEVTTNYAGVRITGLKKVTNTNYLFADIEIEPSAKAGVVNFEIAVPGSKKINWPWELKNRETGSALRKGFDSGDIMVLVMPDRFSNGDFKNDNVAGYADSMKRNMPNARHGGDIQGVINHLDYLKEMGYTALWLNPVLENNLKSFTYHGYAMTDLYKVDPRHGSNQLYRKLSDECAKRGIKLVMDQVMNHVGTNHWFIKDLPTNDWVNDYPDYKICSFRGSTVFDPHASQYDRARMANGWFDHSMADLNQRNPLVANYLIQNSIWWVEFANLGGIRHDTHQYADKAFMARWCTEIMDEYPRFNIVGEVWLNNSASVSYWQKDALNRDGYNSQLPSVMDFPLMFALRNAFNENEGWETGMARLYDLFTLDFLYANPNNIMVFPDNHDMSRFFTMLNRDVDNFRMAMTLVLTVRGYVQQYIGTEILMEGNEGDGHGVMRKDFPGGWPGDSVNAFTGVGLSDTQKEMQSYLRKIQNWRNTSDAVKYGTMIQFVPENGIYVYFRIYNNKRVMVAFNNNKLSKSLPLSRFAECIGTCQKGYNVATSQSVELGAAIELAPKSATILELN